MDRTSNAAELMQEFAERTGLTGDGERKRYLWTDAFAVCNFLALAAATGDARYTGLALRLVDQVHHTLGRFRSDDARSGWLSGAAESDGEAHPTRGGLRIGKALPERGPHEPIDTELEWERDGQYFHYLTKWAHALDQVARVTGGTNFHVWARELVEVAHEAFTTGDERMVWKLSTDLSRPLVSSMGQHDPLDGLVTTMALDSSGPELGCAAVPSLAGAKADFAEMTDWRMLTTSDPLGIGGLIVDAWRLAQLKRPDHEQLTVVLEAAARGLRQCIAHGGFQGRATERLAFRELGMAIGLAALSRLEEVQAERLDEADRRAIDALARYLPLRGAIESFWLAPQHRRAATWIAHTDINEVMLATALSPQGFLGLPLRPGTARGRTRSAGEAFSPHK